MNTSKSKPSEAVEAPAPEADALAAEVALLRKEFKTLLAQVETVGAAARDEAKAVVRAKAAQGVEAGEHVAAELVEDWHAIDRKVVEATRENPWRALGAAALVGLLLGLFMRR